MSRIISDDWVQFDDLQVLDYDKTLCDSIKNSLLSSFTYKQKKIYNDTRQKRVVVGGRRGGKSEEFCAEAIITALQFPHHTIPYVFSLGISKGWDILRPKFEEIQRRHKIDLDYNVGRHTIIVPQTNSKIKLFGLTTKGEADAGRGGEHPLVIIDEAGFAPDSVLKKAIISGWGPTTKQFRAKGGRGLIIGGSPSYLRGTYFDEIAGGNEGDDTHRLTVHDNTYISDPEGIISEWLEENDLTRASSQYIREWLGKFCVDSTGLCYPSYNGKILPDEVIPDNGYTVLGIDFGHTHPCAFVVIRFVQMDDEIVKRAGRDHKKQVWVGHVLETFEQTQLDVFQIEEISRIFTETYGVNDIIADCEDPRMIKHLQKAFSMPVRGVDKSERKANRIWLLDSLFRRNRIRLYSGCETLSSQLVSVPWDDKRKNHNKSVPDHSIDALLYAIDMMQNYNKYTKIPYMPGTVEWEQEQFERDKKRTLAFINKFNG